MAGPAQGQSRAGTGLEQGKSEAGLGWSTAGVGWRRAELEHGRGAVAKLELGCARAELDWVGAGLDWAELSLSRTGAMLKWSRAGAETGAEVEAVGQSRSWDRSRGGRTEQGFAGRIRVLRDEQWPCRTKQAPREELGSRETNQGIPGRIRGL